MKKRNMLYQKILLRKVIGAGVIITISFLSLFGFLIFESNVTSDTSFYEAMLCLCAICAIGATKSYLVLNEMRFAREYDVIDMKIRDYFLYDHSDLDAFYQQPLKVNDLLNKVFIIFIIFGIGSSFASLYFPDVEALRIIVASIGIFTLVLLPIYVYNNALIVERRYNYYKENN